jgi:hypothetical protein
LFCSACFISFLSVWIFNVSFHSSQILALKATLGSASALACDARDDVSNLHRSSRNDSISFSFLPQVSSAEFKGISVNMRRAFPPSPPPPPFPPYVIRFIPHLPTDTFIIRFEAAFAVCWRGRT